MYFKKHPLTQAKELDEAIRIIQKNEFNPKIIEMKKKKENQDDVVVYANGPIFCSACAMDTLSRKEVERRVNEINPSGVNLWKISEENFSDGQKNPHVCEQSSKNRLHYLLNC